MNNPDFVRLGESFGCRSYRVDQGDDLADTLREALDQDVPAIVECRIDYSLNMRLTEKLGHIVCKI